MNLGLYKKPLIILIVLLGAALTGFIVISNQNKGKTLLISTTTSVDNTGLLDYLAPMFKDYSGINLQWNPVGSGQAADLARKGDVDGTLIHAPSLEDGLIADGICVNHTILWYNYFLLIGPANDPANVSESANVTQAFTRIYNAGQNGLTTFYSRGDDSGTQIKELYIWNQTGLTPDAQKDSWYVETGAGMADTIRTANQFQGYTLSDAGTFAKNKAANSDITLVSLFNRDDQILYNRYSFLPINPAKFPSRHYDYALKFREFLLLQSTINAVENYTVANIPLFTPITSS